MNSFSSQRVFALARKDAAELMRNPGAIYPAVLMVFAALFPVVLIIVILPRLVGETLEGSGDFTEQAAAAAAMIPELGGLTGNALVQTFLFHQLALLMLLVPIVAAMALATHAVVGEKQSKALEPLLATPISTVELLAAKTLTPFLFSLGLTWSAAMIYVLIAAAIGEPGVWQAVAGPRLFIMFGLLGPMVAMAALLTSVIVSSRAGDPRSAQQISGLMILPITAVFVGQMLGLLTVGAGTLLLGALGCLVLNAVLLWVGVRVFQRESILTRWR